MFHLCVNKNPSLYQLHNKFEYLCGRINLQLLLDLQKRKISGDQYFLFPLINLFTLHPNQSFPSQSPLPPCSPTGLLLSPLPRDEPGAPAVQLFHENIIHYIQALLGSKWTSETHSFLPGLSLPDIPSRNCHTTSAASLLTCHLSSL